MNINTRLFDVRAVILTRFIRFNQMEQPHLRVAV